MTSSPKRVCRHRGAGQRAQRPVDQQSPPGRAVTRSSCRRRSGRRSRRGCERRRPNSVWSSGRGLLLAADDLASRAIAREVGCARGVVSRWRVRFAGTAGRACRRATLGEPRRYGEDADRRILALLDRPPPLGFARWTAPLLATALGDVSDQYIWRFLRAQRIDLAGRTSWCCRATPSSPPRPPPSSASTCAARERHRARGDEKPAHAGARARAGLPRACRCAWSRLVLRRPEFLQRTHPTAFRLAISGDSSSARTRVRGSPAERDGRA